MSNHYTYLEKHLPQILATLGQDTPANPLIVAHGDKCYSYQNQWEKEGIPFNHGSAIYLLSHLAPYNTECRETTNGWVPVQKWVSENYHSGHKFRKILP